VAGTGNDGLSAYTSTVSGGVNLGITTGLVLTGNASVGGYFRADMNGSLLDLGGFTFTKVNFGDFWLGGGTVTDGNIIVQQGLFGNQGSLLTGTGTITVNPLGTFAHWAGPTAANFTRDIVLAGGRFQQQAGGATTVGSNVAVTSRSIIDRQNGLTFAGVVSGSGDLVLTGSSSLTLANANTFTGTTNVTAGTLILSGPQGSIDASAGIVVTAANLTLDNTGAGNSNLNRVANAVPVSLASSTLLFRGADPASSNSTALINSTETIGTLTLAGGLSTVTAQFNATNAATLTIDNLVRTNGGVALVNGVNLGRNATDTASIGRIFLTNAPALVGTTDATDAGINATVKNTKIVPYLFGEAPFTTGLPGTAGGTFGTFVTYSATGGLRPLNPVDELSTTLTAGDNISLTAAAAQAANLSVNALRLGGTGAFALTQAGNTLNVA
ncbi:MAG: hypothetical protein EBS87_12230, partial [Sphingomonadaceae bacterium]|nr:hypothetical protein [Sphingomonadaceae bacterium]